MLKYDRSAKLNVRMLLILVFVTVSIVVSLFALRQMRRSILSRRSLRLGDAAFAQKDWDAARVNYRDYLGRNTEDITVLKKYAQSCLSVRPLDINIVSGSVTAYRHILRMTPDDESVYETLAKIYVGIGNYSELAYIARMRLEHAPDDKEAVLWQADALIRLSKTKDAQEVLAGFINTLDSLDEKHAEYVRACALMSEIVASDVSTTQSNILVWLNKAVAYAPDSVEALAHRARFYRQATDLPSLAEEVRLELAVKDLDSADRIGTDNPRIRLFLGAEWLSHDELGRVVAELKATEGVSLEKIEEEFFDHNIWLVKRFLLASELAVRSDGAFEKAYLADEVLAELKEKRYRMQVLPSAVGLYIVSGRISDARSCLDEFVDEMHTTKGLAVSKLRLAYLQALVAKAEDKPYVVINALLPAVVNDASHPEMWRLLAEAYNQTDQTRRAVSALIKYLRFRPQDPKMTLQLAKEYLKLQDWSKAFATARLAEPLNPTDVIIKLLRIEASVYIAADQKQKVNIKRLNALSEELAQLRSDNPDRIDIRILQSIIAVYLDDSEKAEKELKLAIEECDEPLRAEMQLVKHYYKAKRVDDAISICQTACKGHADISEPWVILSDLYVLRREHDLAITCLKGSLDSVSGRWEKRVISLKLALLEILHADRSAGIGILSALAAEDKQEIRARSLLLDINEVRKDVQFAEKLVEELRQAEGESGLLWRLHKSVLLLSSDDWRSKQQDVAELLGHCINLDPQWSSPVLLLAKMYEKLDDSRRIEDICRQSLINNPSATDVADVLVTLLEKQGRFSDAEKVLQQSDLAPGVVSSWQIKAALRTGDFSRAIDELKLRASNNDQDANSRILLARLVYWQTRDAEMAFEYLKEAESIASGSMAITSVKVAILKAEGKAKEAQQMLNYYVTNSEDFGAYVMRAAYLSKEGEFERAEADYRKLTTFEKQGAIGYILLGDFYIRSDRLDKAIVALREGVDSYSDDLRIRRVLMKTLLLRGQQDDRQSGIAILAFLEEKLPQDPELLKFRAVQILEDKLPLASEMAKEKLEKAIRLEPTAVDSHLILINIEIQEKNFEGARDHAIRAIGANPNQPRLMTARSRAEYELGNMQMACSLALLVLEKEPGNVGAQEVLTASALASGNRSLMDDARTAIETALANDSNNEKFLISRTRILSSMGLHKAAIPELAVYCQTQEGSQSIDALVLLADMYRLAGDMDRSKQITDLAQQVDPTSQAVTHSRVLWLVAQKQFKELEGISENYISTKDQSVTTVIKAATILSSQDSMELKKEGIKLFEHAVSLSPASKFAHLGLATSLCLNGESERAEKLYQELLERYPNDVQILNDLAWLIQDYYDRYDSALELADRGLSLAPNNTHLLDTRGTILMKMPGRQANAKADFQRLIDLSPADTPMRARAHLQLVRLCVQSNDNAGAKQHIETALEIDQKTHVFTPEEHAEISDIFKNI